MRKIQRTTITYARSNAQGNGRGDKLSEVKDELSSPMLPLLELPDLKPGEGVTVRVHFYRPLETSPGSKLYEAMSEHADGIRAGMIGGDDWGDLSAETRELFERAAMAVR